jgi:hypothetical protein
MAPQVSALIALAAFAITDTVCPQVRTIDPLGKHTVGSKLADVRAYKASENCSIKRNSADCAFTDSSGVEYVVLDDSVITVSATEKTARRGMALPFGLKFGEDLGTAARKLVPGKGTWIIHADPDTSTGIVLTSGEKYLGKNGWDFIVEITFNQGRLVGISYNSGTI